MMPYVARAARAASGRSLVVDLGGPHVVGRGRTIYLDSRWKSRGGSGLVRMSAIWSVVEM